MTHAVTFLNPNHPKTAWFVLPRARRTVHGRAAERREGGRDREIHLVSHLRTRRRVHYHRRPAANRARDAGAFERVSGLRVKSHARSLAKTLGRGCVLDVPQRDLVPRLGHVRGFRAPRDIR